MPAHLSVQFPGALCHWIDVCNNFCARGCQWCGIEIKLSVNVSTGEESWVGV